MTKMARAIVAGLIGCCQPAIASAQSCPASIGTLQLELRPGPSGQPINQHVCVASGNCFMLCKYGFNPSLPDFSTTLEWRPFTNGPTPQFPGSCTRNTAGNVIVSQSRQAVVSWAPITRPEAGSLARTLLATVEPQSAACPQPTVTTGPGASPGVDTRNPSGGPGLFPSPPPPATPRFTPSGSNSLPTLFADRFAVSPEHPTLSDSIEIRVRVSDPDFEPLQVSVILWNGTMRMRDWYGNVTFQNGYPEVVAQFPNTGAPGNYRVDVSARDSRGAETRDTQYGTFTVTPPIAILTFKTIRTAIIRARANTRFRARDLDANYHGALTVPLYESDQVDLCAWGLPRFDQAGEIHVMWPADHTYAVVRFNPKGSPTLCQPVKFGNTFAGTANDRVLMEVAQWGVDNRTDSVFETVVKKVLGGPANTVLPVISFLSDPTNMGAGSATFEQIPWRRTTIELRSEVLITRIAGSLNMKVFEGAPTVQTVSGRVAASPGQQVSVSAGGDLVPTDRFDPATVAIPWWRSQAQPDFTPYAGPEWRMPLRRNITFTSYPSGRLANGDGSVSFANDAFVVRSSRDLGTWYVVGETMANNFDAVATIGSVAGSGQAGAGLYLSRSPVVGNVLDGDVYFGRAPGGVLLQLRRNNQWENLPMISASLPSVDGWDQFAMTREGDAYQFRINGQVVARYPMPGRGAERVDFFTAPGAVAEMRRWSVVAW